MRLFSTPAPQPCLSHWLGHGQRCMHCDFSKVANQQTMHLTANVVSGWNCVVQRSGSWICKPDVDTSPLTDLSAISKLMFTYREKETRPADVLPRPQGSHLHTADHQQSRGLYCKVFHRYNLNPLQGFLFF